MVDDSRVYGDERFIFHMGNEYNAPHENNIYDGYIIANEEKVVFERRTVLNGRISVIMPEAYVVMPQELAEIKYPSKMRPDEIYTNEDTTINFTLSHKNDKAANEDIPKVKDIIQKAVMRMHSGSRVIDSSSMEASGINIAYFDFCSPALDMDLYNMMFFLSVDMRIVVGAFNCPQESMDTWKPVIEQMLGSVEMC